MTDVDKSKDIPEAPKDFDGSMALATTNEERIKVYYQFGKGSIQDLARVYRMTVDEVLVILNLEDTGNIETQGDLIDQQEAGPEVNVNFQGRTAKAHFTTD